MLRGAAIDPAGLQAVVAGSYSSAVATYDVSLSWPPVTSTWPLRRRVAVWPPRARAIVPAGVQRFVAGSYTSPAARYRLPSLPPATSTRPFSSVVAVWR